MKKLLLLFTLMIGMSVSAQFTEELETVKTEIGRSKGASINHYIKGDSEQVLFFFRNLKYSSIIDLATIDLKDMDGIDALYNVVVKELSNTTGTIKTPQEKDLKLDNGNTLSIQTLKSAGIVQVQFWLWDGYKWEYSTFFTKKNIDKLFGKK